MEKMSTIKQIETRKKLYQIIISALTEKGYEIEPIKGGVLIGLEDGYYAKGAISICDPEKVDGWKHEYAEQVRKNAEKAALKAEKDQKKAQKAAERVKKNENINKENVDNEF